MNFARDIVDAASPERLALVEIGRGGTRREWLFGDIADRASRLAGTLERHGVRRGQTVLTLIGNRPEWVMSMVACFRIGAVVVPCNEQLRPHDIALRLRVCRPAVVICDERNRGALEAAAPSCTVLLVPDESLFASEPAPAVELTADDPCLVTFTSGTAGEPKGVLHAQRYLPGQRLQAQQWMGARSGDLVWCTAATGWSKSARNAFIAPWLQGAAALLHDARFDPHERLELAEREHVSVLCMAPTEYRVIAKRAVLRPIKGMRELLAAGEALDSTVLQAWKEGSGLDVRDGYGQTETGQITANPAGHRPRERSMGRPLPGIRLRVEDGELVVESGSLPTFFSRYLGEDGRARDGVWRTGDRVSQDDEGYLYFEGRTDDIIISAGYRIGPFEVESALMSHPAVAEAAVVAAADEERGSIVRAVIVLRDGNSPGEPLVQALQEHVKQRTAPYKYPRLIEFADELPKTSTGKVRRAKLREGS